MTSGGVLGQAVAVMVSEPSALEQLRAALRYLLHVDSWLALAVLALLLASLEQLGGLPFVGSAAGPPAAQVVWASYFYLVLRRAAAGSRRLPQLGDYRDSWETLILPLLQGAVVSLYFVGPFAACVATTVGWQDFAERLRFNPLALLRERHALIYSVLALELVYLPAALLGTCATRRLGPLFDPSFGLRRALALGPPYVRTFAVLGVLMLVGVGVASVAELLLLALPIPLVAATVAQLLQLWVPLAQMRLLGELAHRRLGPARD